MVAEASSSAMAVLLAGVRVFKFEAQRTEQRPNGRYLRQVTSNTTAAVLFLVIFLFLPPPPPPTRGVLVPFRFWPAGAMS
eukprot:CAMPEP_0171933456 /NCGR_PEP_ID=MMETSP0993-20121228/31279_1 /TAXON_ID=483369 /ORGANISM="non described non described, Strain CCMP2098" /LENGTH=79 /DNA_ID=CAMNT_0012573973 /DNA_START=74 /DNA_END=310 /DNA_ORIENTATION=+